MSTTESTQTEAAGAQEAEDDVRARNDGIRFSGCTPVCDHCDRAAYWIARHESPQLKNEQLCSPGEHEIDQLTLDSIDRLTLNLE